MTTIIGISGSLRRGSYNGSGHTSNLSSTGNLSSVKFERIRTLFPSYGIRIGKVRIFSPTPLMGVSERTRIAASGDDRDDLMCQHIGEERAQPFRYRQMCPGASPNGERRRECPPTRRRSFPECLPAA